MVTVKEDDFAARRCTPRIHRYWVKALIKRYNTCTGVFASMLSRSGYEESERRKDVVVSEKEDCNEGICEVSGPVALDVGFEEDPSILRTEERSEGDDQRTWIWGSSFGYEGIKNGKDNAWE